MSTLLLYAIVSLAVAICAFAGLWFYRESKEREQKRKRARATRAANLPSGRSAPPTWDGGIKTSPRQLR